jgi:TonB family protein
MSMLRRLLMLVFASCPIFVRAQFPEAGSDNVYHVGGDVVAPKLLRKIDPVYSDQARANLVQGSCLWSVVVGTNGRIVDATLVSPLGYGLDEKALEAILKWEFKPATKNGIPVKIIANIEVNFVFPQLSFDRKAEERRTAFNRAIRQLDQKTDAERQRGVAAIGELSRNNFPAAQLLQSQWLERGEHGVSDPTTAAALLRKAASANFGPAMYELGRQMVAADARDEKGLSLIRDAATLGSIPAQFFMARQAEAGQPPDLERAKRNYRLCAAKGEAACQFNLSQLMLNTRGVKQNERIQALAWLRLAAAQVLDPAKSAWAQEAATLNEADRMAVDKLSKQLVRP